MRHLYLNGSHWQSRDDFYDAFFRAVQAPSWHGRNFGALWDSIGTGGINQIELPYTIHIAGYSKMSEQAREIVDAFVDLIRELSCGHDVAVDVS